MMTYRFQCLLLHPGDLAKPEPKLPVQILDPGRERLVG